MGLELSGWEFALILVAAAVRGGSACTTEPTLALVAPDLGRSRRSRCLFRAQWRGKHPFHRLRLPWTLYLDRGSNRVWSRKAIDKPLTSLREGC